MDSGVPTDCRVLVLLVVVPEGGFERDDTDEVSNSTTPATRLLGVLTDDAGAEEDTVFSSTITRRLDVLYTLLLMVVFFLVGVSNPTCFMAFGTEIKPSDAATIWAASLSFASLVNSESFFDMLVDACNGWEPR